jgi:hypothetical protein
MKSIIFEVDENSYLVQSSVPIDYKRLFRAGGNTWCDDFVHYFKVRTPGKVKFIVRNTNAPKFKIVTILELGDSKSYTSVTFNKQTYYIPCPKALHIFFGKTIPNQFYLRVVKA